MAVPKEPAPTTTARREPGDGRESPDRDRSGTARGYKRPPRNPRSERLAEAPGGIRDRLRRPGLVHGLQVEDPLLERAQRIRAHDRVARHAGLAAAHGGLPGGLALERLLIDPPLARDAAARGAHPRVEPERVEHETGAGFEHGSERRPQATRQATRRPGH